MQIVLVHGTLDRASSFNRVLRHVDAVTYDRRGYASRAHEPAASLAEHVDDLLAVMDELPSVVAGHSFGAIVALAAAIRRPDLVRAVVSYEAPMPWQPWWPAHTAGGDAVRAPTPAAAAEAFMRRMIGDDRWERLPAHTKEARRAEGPALLAELRDVRTHAPFDLADVGVPVVVGVGSESAPHQRAAAPLVVEHLTDATLTEIEGASHGAHLTHPREFADLVRLAVKRASG